MRYILTTENKQLRKIKKLVIEHLDYATLSFHTGLWKGGFEKSVSIKYVGKAKDREILVALADRINLLNNQKCSMLERQPTTKNEFARVGKETSLVEFI